MNLAPITLLLLALPAAAAAVAPLPAKLHDTGLYEGDSLRVRPENLAFAPQYPLWTDGATKQRWIYLPPGSAIDAASPTTWDFPPGTKLWKQFGYGKPVETRHIERLADGSWRFAAYVWNEAGTAARLAPARGIPRHASAAAPGGRYDIPARSDCLACHDGGGPPVLGFSALQLSASELNAGALAARGLLRGLPANAPRRPHIPADSPLERAALGYLHGNCGHCHNGHEAAPPVDLLLQQDGSVEAVAATRRSLTRGRSRYAGTGAVVSPGNAGASVLVARMRSRTASEQMPPLGTRLPDPEGLALVQRWIDSLEPPLEQHP